jgi:glyoxylase I family protein
LAGKNDAIGGGGFHHVAIRAKDFDASVRFYTQAMGFKQVMAWGEGKSAAVMLDTGDGSCLEIFAGGDGKPKEEGAVLHFALNTTDVDAATERARRAGVQITTEPTRVDIPTLPKPTPVRLAFFKGPDGEIVELFHKL